MVPVHFHTSIGIKTDDFWLIVAEGRLPLRE